MTKSLLFASLFLVICASHAQIYKWTDAQGNFHLSYTPQANAEKLDLPEVQTYSLPPLRLEDISQRKNSNEKTEHVYTEVLIIKPLNEATIRNNDGSIEVKAHIKPNLLPGDTVQLVFDGATLGEPVSSLQFQLKGIYRGSHTLAIQILDANGDVLNTSDAITVFMFRPRVGM